MSRDGDHWVFRITSPVGSRENRFKIGEEYEVKTSFANFKVCSFPCPADLRSRFYYEF